MSRYVAALIRVWLPGRAKQTGKEFEHFLRELSLYVTLEALRDAIRTRKATVDEILRTAEVCRAHTVMKTFLEVAVR